MRHCSRLFLPTHATALAVLSTLLLGAAGAAHAQAGVANCAKAKPGLEVQLCKDEALMALDKKMAEVLSAAEPIAAKEKPPMLKAEQRGWGKNRDECLKAGDASACLKQSYVRRIAELQATYRLVQPTASATYSCGSKPSDQLKTALFPTDPPTMVAELDENVSVLYQKTAALGTSYAGDQVSFFEMEGQAKVVWGPGTPEIKCKKE